MNSLRLLTSVLGFVSAQPGPSYAHSELQVMGRTGYVYKPKSAALLGAVVVLHGSGGVASDMFDLGFEELADSRGFLVVYPEMQVAKSNNWGYTEDIPYFSALAQRMQESDFGIPADKLFICGHSAGGTMVTFLQNEMDEYAAAGVVEAAVGHLEDWTMARRGKPTMVVWNHKDPVLKQYAPGGVEMAYYNLTVETLRRGASTLPDVRTPMPFARPVTEAELLSFNKAIEAPRLEVISWSSQPGKHKWALPSWTNSLDASQLLVDFFLGSATAVV